MGCFMRFLGICLTIAAAFGQLNVPFLRLDKGGEEDTFLQDWVGHLLPLLGNQTLLDLTLPGCHDCMTWDDSNTVADDANDISPELAYLLHDFGDLAGAGNLIRSLSRTQGLNMTEMLNNGMRFIDFRLILTAPPNSPSSGHHDWYSLHLVQSNQGATLYLTELRQFLDAHPSEIVVIFFSQHGNVDKTGDAQYPEASPADKQAFYKQILTLFDGLVFNATISSVKETTVNEMIERGHRLVIYASDWAEFTNSDPTVIDTHVNLINEGVGGLAKGALLTTALDYFEAAGDRKAETKVNGRFLLLAMPGKPSDQQMESVAELKYIPFGHSTIRKSCAKSHGVPGMDKWCPPTLVAEGQLANYYYQIALDEVVANGGGKLDLPNALYMDAIDVGGVLRTGTADLPVMSPQKLEGVNKTAEAEKKTPSTEAEQKTPSTEAEKKTPSKTLIDGVKAVYSTLRTLKLGAETTEGGEDDDDDEEFAYLDVHEDAPFATTGFAYVDTVLLYNVQRVCSDPASAGVDAATCFAWMLQLDKRRASAPLTLWNDPAHGRRQDWPVHN